MAIEHESSQIALTVTRYSREIELVQEYRTRLISDVVTGKLDVRDGAMVGRYDKSATCR
jgi:type I restriction enzyme S subunit